MDPTNGVRIAVARDGAAARLTVAGDIDAESAPALEQSLAEIEADPPSVVDVDLADVGFIDSSGLRVLIVSSRRIAEAGGSMRIVTASAAVCRLLELTGLTEMFGNPPPAEGADRTGGTDGTG